MYYLIKICYIILSRLSRNSIVKIGRFIGGLMYIILIGRRKIAYKNCSIMRISNPDVVVKAAFKNIFTSFLELFIAKKIINEQFIKDNVIIDENDEIFSYVKTDKPLILVSGHIGAWEFLPVMYTKYTGKKFVVVGRRLKNVKVNDFVTELRSSDMLVYLEHRNVADKIMKYIDESVGIGVLLDHSSMSKDSIFVELFGKKTTFIAGIPLIAVRKNIPIFSVFLVRENGSFRLVSYPPILQDKSIPVKDRIYVTARKINEIYEDVMKRYPDQWYLIHKRFKTVEGDDGKISNSVY